MNVLVGLLLGLAGGVFLGLLVADVRGWLLRGCRGLVVLAAGLLPERHRPRYVEEWQANLIAIQDTPLSMIILAIWTAIRAPRWAAKLRSEPDRQDEAEGAVSEVLPSRFPGLNPRYTFFRFTIGAGNRLAHGAALAVAEAPSEAYNPLFLHGPPGVGKTHLMSAIAAHLRTNCPGLNVRYTTAESFTNELVRALKTSGSSAFQDRYRDLNVLLIDDVQFLQGKPTTEEEFFHTFNALYETGSQIVLSADRAPGELSTLGVRLRDRFEWGLTVAIGSPDLRTRLIVLQRLVEEAGVEIADDDALTELAQRVNTNIRQLHGALIRVLAHASLLGRPLTAELIAEVIPERPARAQYSVELIQEKVADSFGITRSVLVGSSRAATPLRARQVSMFLTRDLSDLPLPQIGKMHGGRDHTTVLNSLRRVEARMADDSDFADLIAAIRSTILKQ